MTREWMTSDKVGTIYKRRLSDKGPYGIHSAPRGVSWYLCVEHTGDNHYKYRKVGLFGGKKDIIYLELGNEFSMYGGGGIRCHWQPTDRQFHLLMAGEKVMIESGVKE